MTSARLLKTATSTEKFKGKFLRNLEDDFTENMICKRNAFRHAFNFSFKKISCAVFLLFILLPLSAQKYSIDYFGIVANGVDDNMSKMTSDLYYTQLCEINSYTVQDKRNGVRMSNAPQTDEFQDGKISLYAVISKKDDSSKWISTITIYDSSRSFLI